MTVRLKVLSGGSAGKELRLKAGQFVIGRSDSCHLRPRSDAISRKHCVFFIDQEHVRVRDLKSRNGTLVNGKKIVGDHNLNKGDKVTVGPLEFEVLIGAKQAASAQKSVQPQAAQKRPVVQSQQKKMSKAKAPSGSDSVADDDIFSWLEEADKVEHDFHKNEPSTRQFKIDKEGEVAPSSTDNETVDISKAVAQMGDTSIGKEKKKKKKEYGKLPPAPDKQTENSQQAAADALKDFFKRP